MTAERGPNTQAPNRALLKRFGMEAVALVALALAKSIVWGLVLALAAIMLEFLRARAKKAERPDPPQGVNDLK